MDKIIEQIKTSRRPVVIAAPAVIKKLTATLAEARLFRNVTYKLFRTAAEDLLGSWKPAARLAVARDLKVSPEHTEILLANSLFARPGVSRKVDELCALRERYKEYLDYSGLILDFYRGREVIIVGDYGTDDLFNRARAILTEIANVISHATDSFIRKPVPIYRFKDYKEEILALGYEVASLIYMGVRPDNIKIQKPPASYMPYFDEVFFLLGIEYASASDFTLSEYEVTKEIMTALAARRGEKLSAALPDILKRYRDYENPVISAITGVFNRYMAYDLTVAAIYADLTYSLSTSRLPAPDYRGAVILTDLRDDVAAADDHWFIPVFNQDIFPATHLDDDYLDDDEKATLGLLTAREANRREKARALASIDRAPRLYLSYSLMAPDGMAVKSPLVSAVIEKHGAFEQEYKRPENVSYSRALDIIALGKRLDNYYKYDVREEGLEKLLAAYPDHSCLTYKNAFNGLEPDTYKRLFRTPFVLSYTSIDKYYRCAFAFYLEKIIKLTRGGNEEALYIGNLFHYCLEALLAQPDISDTRAFLEEKVASYLSAEGKEPTAREKHFIEKYLAILEKLADFFREQNENSSFAVYGLEKEFEVPLGEGVVLKGKIDKILTTEADGVTYAIVIDYKSGEPEVDLNRVVHGLDLQLPIYFYLLNSGGHEYRFAGMYLQKVLPSGVFARQEGKTYEDQLHDYFRLKGYTNGDRSVLQLINRDFMVSGFRTIAGLRLTGDGSIHKTDAARVLTDAEFARLMEIVGEKLMEARDGIRAGKFPINPKKNNKIDSCEYCPYRDVCFREEADYRELVFDKNLSFIREAP